MMAYKSCLVRSKQFTDEYCVLDLPHMNTLNQLDAELLRMSYIYSNLDLLILGFVYPHTGSPDWRTVKSWVNEKCEVILVTNAAFKGYFPQRSTTSFPETFLQLGPGDKNLNKMIREGKSSYEILRALTSTSFYSAEMVNRFYENALKKLERGESECDIQIGDYIRKYGKQKRLMYNNTHPPPMI